MGGSGGAEDDAEGAAPAPEPAKPGGTDATRPEELDLWYFGLRRRPPPGKEDRR